MNRTNLLPGVHTSKKKNIAVFSLPQTKRGRQVWLLNKKFSTYAIASTSLPWRKFTNVGVVPKTGYPAATRNARAFHDERAPPHHSCQDKKLSKYRNSFAYDTLCTIPLRRCDRAATLMLRWCSDCNEGPWACVVHATDMFSSYA
jgi:hypothetical protein